MKKLFSLFFVFLVILFTQGCQSGKNMDICMFADRFNKIYGSDKILYDDLNGVKTENGVEYEIILSEENHCEKLICAEADQDLNLTEISLTIDGNNISDKDKKRFSELSAIITDIYTLGTDSFEDVQKKLKENTQTSDNGYSSYHETHRFSYYIVSNNAGIIFNIKSLLLNSAESEVLTLRE